MQDERWWFTMTTLLNGKVLAAAGYSYETYDLASAELYNPTTGTWSPTGSMRNARFSPAVWDGIEEDELRYPLDETSTYTLHRYCFYVLAAVRRHDYARHKG